MKNILLVGEVCEDIHVYGHCTRLNPEAPTPVLNFEKEEKNIGMSGNVFANLHSLSGDNRVCIRHIYNHETIIKTRFVDKKHGYILLRVDNDIKINRLYGGIESTLIREIEFGDFDALVVSDYNKGFLPNSTLFALSYAAQSEDIPSFIDTKKKYSEWADNFDFVKINNQEYIENGWENYKGKGNIIVTQGEKGALMYDRTGKIATFNTYPKQVVNVSGAGDTFLAGFVISILNGQTLEKSVEYANKAAGVAVSLAGIVAVKDIDIK